MFVDSQNPFGTRSVDGNWDDDALVLDVIPYSSNKVYLCNINDKATIDWGDGSTSTFSGGTSTTQASHTYSDGVTIHRVICHTTATQVLAPSSRNRGRLCIVNIHHMPVTITSITQYMFTYGSSSSTYVSPLQKADLRACRITSLPSNAFAYCTSLYKVLLPETLTSISSGTFTGCTALNEISIPSGVTSLPATSATYYNSTPLTNVFSGAGLVKINIGKSVQETTYPVAGCLQYLKEITADEDGTGYWASGNTLIKNSTNEVDTLCQNSVVPSSVTALGQYCGAMMGGSVYTLASHIKTIGDYAFVRSNTTTFDLTNCTSLTSVGKRAFYYSYAKYVYLPVTSSTTYSEYTFYRASNLVEVDFGGHKFANYMFSNSSTANTTFTTLHLHPNYSTLPDTTDNLFQSRNGFSTIKFHGTMAQWNANSALTSLFGTASSDGGTLNNSSATYTSTTLTIYFV